MSDSKLPTEVELIYEVMPCNAMRTLQEPGPLKHPCSYFRQWGTYHSFDYIIDSIPTDREVPLKVKYVGRAALIPETLSGCRKSPIMAIGINPNLPGWFRNKRGSLNPLFDDYKQYAHYFRYRSTYKLIVPESKYLEYGGGDHDTPPLSNFLLNVPLNQDGIKEIDAKVDEQTMYTGYLGLLHELGQNMGWDTSELNLEEDFSYMNMVACPSARWRTQPDPTDPELPPMTRDERDGIVNECFRERKYFFRQLFQSLPKVIIVFSQSTANPFIQEMKGSFIQGEPELGENVEDLLDRHIRVSYGTLENGTTLDARVIFSPHISGDPERFLRLRTKVLDQLLDEAKSGRLNFNETTKHLSRPRGICSFCSMLEIGPCPYQQELQSIVFDRTFLADTILPAEISTEKKAQSVLYEKVSEFKNADHGAWNDEPEGFVRE